MRQASVRILAATVALVAATAPAARAQGVGFQGGVSVDPEQVFAGSHFETRALFGQLHFRPGIDGGVGDGLTVATLNIDIIYKVPLQGTRWTLYQGSGPTVAFTRVNGETDVGAGFGGLFGIAHENGFFTEFRATGGNAPTLKFAVGFTLRKRRP